MKIVGIILIILGIAVFIFQGVRSTRKEKIIDVGPLEISKKEERSDDWQLYAAGGIAVVAGLILVITSRGRPAN
ncbi:MAG TPA: hypothetical protein VFZ33_15515 [Chitinophagaceae bacterium]